MSKPTISGEQHKKMQTKIQPQSNIVWISIALTALVICIALIVTLAVVLQAPRSSNDAGNTQPGSRDITAPSGPGGSTPSCSGSDCTSRNDGGGGIAPVMGTVVEAKNTALTIKLDNGKTQTFTITSSTQEAGSQSSQTYNKDHFTTGTMVGVIPTSVGASEARLLLLYRAN